MGTRTLVSGQLSSPEVGLPCFYSRTQAHLRSFRHTGYHAGKSNIVQGCSCHPKGRRANFHVQKLERQHVVTSAQQATETSSTLTQQPDLQDPEATNLELPCLAGGGGGIFFFWQLGKSLSKFLASTTTTFIHFPRPNFTKIGLCVLRQTLIGLGTVGVSVST